MVKDNLTEWRTGRMVQRIDWQPRSCGFDSRPFIHVHKSTFMHNIYKEYAPSFFGEHFQFNALYTCSVLYFLELNYLVWKYYIAWFLNPTQTFSGIWLLHHGIRLNRTSDLKKLMSGLVVLIITAFSNSKYFHTSFSDWCSMSQPWKWREVSEDTGGKSSRMLWGR